MNISTNQYFYGKLALVGVGAIASALTVIWLATPSDPRPPKLTPAAELPLFVLPDHCTVTGYDRLGRATHISCVLDASKQDIAASNQAELDAATEAGYSEGFADAADQVTQAAVMDCTNRAQASASVHSMLRTASLDLCEAMRRSLRAQFANATK